MFESRLLADAIDQALPRELRDMIYSFCWEETLKKYDDHLNMRPWRANDTTQAELDGDGCHTCEEYRFPPHPRAKAFQDYPLYHLADPAYVGLQAAREAVQVFYRMMPAYVETLDSDIVEDYFIEDRFGVGIAPCDLVTSITFFLDPCRQRCEVGFPYDYDLGYRQGPKCLDDYTLETMRLTGPEKRSKIPSIVFLVNANGSHVMGTLRWSRTLYDQLKALGASITVTYCCKLPYYDVEVEPLDLGTIMDMPESEWDSHFLNEIQKCAPDQYTRILNDVTYRSRRDLYDP